jgi:SAM-dependent methyltransferase
MPASHTRSGRSGAVSQLRVDATWNHEVMSEPWSADPRMSFDSAAETYNEVRPTYPPQMFDELFGLLPARPLILEVGPGTGQATRDLIDHGATVHAIELGPAMAAKLGEVLPSRELTITVGDFEHVPVADNSIDALFSATAYHWISPRAQLERPVRLLKRGGLIAIVDVNQVSSSDDDGFFAAAQHIYERYGQRHTGPPLPERRTVDPPIRSTLFRDDRFVDLEVRSYDWNQTYSAAGYRKLMLSYSVTQMMERSAREGLLDDVERFVDEHFDGQVTRPLVVTLTTAMLAG